MSKSADTTNFFELGDRTALICGHPSKTEIARNTLKELGFKSHAVDSEDEALEELRYTQYNCIVVFEDFAGATLASNPVMKFLTPLPMAQRRNSFVCLIGASFKTLDAMQAFAESVHVVVNPSDLPNLAAILNKGLKETEMAYRIYRIAVDAQGERRSAVRRT